MINTKNIKIVQDVDKALRVMKSVGLWMEESGKNPSKPSIFTGYVSTDHLLA